MGAGVKDIFGGGSDAAAATDGSYGEAPSGFRLPPGTSLGPAHLQIASLDRSLAYYEDVLGLRMVERGDAVATLAAQADNRILVVLHERAGSRPMVPRGRLGLYHFAILLPDRGSLGRFARHLARKGENAGASDHLVSEAFYLTDPDGLGIEVYRDRPRALWRRVGRELMMATDPIDMATLLQAAGDVPWAGMPAGTVIGHVHLHVGDLPTAARFFSETLGFDRMVWHYPGALFLGADGYHHHLGTNTWGGTNAEPPTSEDARLQEWTIDLPDSASLSAVTRSLLEAGYDAEESNGETITQDPWGTSVRLRVGVEPLLRAVPRAVTS